MVYEYIYQLRERIRYSLEAHRFVLDETILTKDWALFRWHAYIWQRWVIVGPLALGTHVRWPSARPTSGNDWSRLVLGTQRWPTVGPMPT